MIARRSPEDPPKPIARPSAGRAALRAEFVSADEPHWCAELESWIEGLAELERRPLTPVTRAKMQDSRRVVGELLRVLRRQEPGEGRPEERSLLAVRALGRVQALSTMFACPRGTFVELLVTAPWNLLGRGDPADPRTLHGAGTALVERAVAWSRRRGCAGRVALQAASLDALRFYERLGFRRLVPGDLPLSLVPPGERGWSPEVLRVANGTPGPDEERAPWVLVEPDLVPMAREPAARWGASPAA